MVDRPIAVLIVAFRAASKLNSCLLSIEAHLPNHDIHIWDNSGPDFSDMRLLAEKHKKVHWYFSDLNIGFAAAVNKLAETVPDHDLLLVNPDAQLVGPIPLTRAAIREPGVAAVAPLVSGLDASDYRPRLFSNRNAAWDIVAYRKLTLMNSFGGAAGLGSRLRGTFFSYQYRNQPGDVDGFLAGTCLAISREALDSVGCFDEEFFLYLEEAEWQRRAKSAGWRLLLVDEIGVSHLPKGTVSEDLDLLTRSKDLALSGMVLMVEYCWGRRAGDIYSVWASAIENLARRVRGQRGAVMSRPDVLITADGGLGLVTERVSTALSLDDAGYSVAFVSLQRLGTLPRDLPPSIRLIRRPWWWPSVAPQESPAVLLMGKTVRERAFARIFRIRRNTTCVAADDVIAILPSVVGFRQRGSEHRVHRND